MTDILLIEDDDLLREHLRDGLIEAGHQVREAESGDQGLAMFEAEPADLVITDLIMDDGEGVSTIRTLRGACSRTPIIAISGNPLYLDNSVKLGANLGLLKPFRMGALLDAVRAALPASGLRSA